MSALPDLAPLQRALLGLHKALIAWARLEYERTHGRQSNVAFLQLLTTEASFAWLDPLTTLIIAVDELEAEPGGERTLRELLKPDAKGSAFQQHYARALLDDPTVAAAHGEVVRLLK